MKRFLIVLCLSAAPLHAGTMGRVVEINDGRTLTIEINSRPARVTLSGVVISPADEPIAAAYLRRLVESAHVLVEGGSGGSFVYRSPDALFINGEMARGAYRQSGPKMIWLGEVDPAPRRATSRGRSAPRRPQVQATMKPPKPRAARRQPRGAHRIPRLPSIAGVP